MNKVILPLLAMGIAAGVYIAYDNATTSFAEELALEVGNDAMYVPDQPTTSSVEAAFAAPSKNSFIVVSTYLDGKADERLGISDLLAAGVHNDVSIHLTRSMQEGETLIAQLYADNGDGVLTASDNLLRDAGGDTVFTVFFARAHTILPVITTNAEVPETATEELLPDAALPAGDTAPADSDNSTEAVSDNTSSDSEESSTDAPVIDEPNSETPVSNELADDTTSPEAPIDDPATEEPVTPAEEQPAPASEEPAADPTPPEPETSSESP